MRSVEKCQALKCKPDEDCYVTDVADEKTGTVTSTLVCAPKDPCAVKSCGDDAYCENIFSGDRPPVAQCKPYDEDPCENKQCDDGYNCAVRRGLYAGHSYVVETFCIEEVDCTDCDFTYQFCEITEDGGGGASGKCASFKDRWSDE